MDEARHEQVERFNDETEDDPDGGQSAAVESGVAGGDAQQTKPPSSRNESVNGRMRDSARNEAAGNGEETVPNPSFGLRNSSFRTSSCSALAQLTLGLQRSTR